ncbi:MAG TPA: hypothetical protein VFH78_15230, partial [Candidatus Thermoplasmatota archaeon]|nr:hypothetical protein [Candidatus Thermoplasmatota archaeon]
ERERGWRERVADAFRELVERLRGAGDEDEREADEALAREENASAVRGRDARAWTPPSAAPAADAAPPGPAPTPTPTLGGAPPQAPTPVVAVAPDARDAASAERTRAPPCVACDEAGAEAAGGAEGVAARLGLLERLLATLRAYLRVG